MIPEHVSQSGALFAPRPASTLANTESSSPVSAKQANHVNSAIALLALPRRWVSLDTNDTDGDRRLF